MTKRWLKNYHEDVSYQIDVKQYDSLLSLFHKTTKTFKSKIAYSCAGTELSFDEIEVYSRHFSAYLQNKLGVKKGDNIALMCPNILSFPVAMWGIIRAGGVQVNVNPMYTARELQHQMTDAQVETIIVFSAATKTLAEIIKSTSIKNVITINKDDFIVDYCYNANIDERLTNPIPFVQALKEGEKLTLIEPKLTKSDLLFLQYTGGTTGLSKGAMLSHGNLIANYLQYNEFCKNIIEEGNEVVITAIPMYHIFALMVNTLGYFFLGAYNILVTDPRNMSEFIELWKRTPVTFFTGVNTLFKGLLQIPGFSDIDFSSLKLCIGGGAAIQQAVADKWLNTTGVRLQEGYGLSETSPIVTLNLGNETGYIPGIGIPLPLTDVVIRNNDGMSVSCGESGELCVKGPQVMSGYWNNIEDTNMSRTEDGYFRTGDIGKRVISPTYQY